MKLHRESYTTHRAIHGSAKRKLRSPEYRLVMRERAVFQMQQVNQYIENELARQRT